MQLPSLLLFTGMLYSNVGKGFGLSLTNLDLKYALKIVQFTRSVKRIIKHAILRLSMHVIQTYYQISIYQQLSAQC